MTTSTQTQPTPVVFIKPRMVVDIQVSPLCLAYFLAMQSEHGENE